MYFEKLIKYLTFNSQLPFRFSEDKKPFLQEHFDKLRIVHNELTKEKCKTNFASDIDNYLKSSNDAIKRVEFLTDLENQIEKSDLSNSNISIDDVYFITDTFYKSFPNYQQFSKGITQFILQSEQNSNNIQNLLKISQKCYDIKQLPNYHSSTDIIASLLKNMPYNVIENFNIFINVNSTTENYGLMIFETSVFTSISILSFFSLVYALHYTGNFCLFFNEIKSKIELKKSLEKLDLTEKTSNLSKNIFQKQTPFKRHLTRTKNFLYSNKYSITLGSFSVSALGMLIWSYTTKPVRIVAENKSLLENIINRDLVLQVQSNLTYAATIFGETSAKVSRALVTAWYDVYRSSLEEAYKNYKNLRDRK